MTLDYAVHLSGALVARDMQWIGTPPPALLEAIRDGLGPMPTAEFRNPDAAVRFAERLKQASPDDLVTIVLWPADHLRAVDADPYEQRVRQLEGEGLTRSDAQAAAEAEGLG